MDGILLNVRDLRSRNGHVRVLSRRSLFANASTVTQTPVMPSNIDRSTWGSCVSPGVPFSGESSRVKIADAVAGGESTM